MNSLKSSLKVRLILFNQGKILLLKQTKLNGGNYTLVGGNVELGETS
jgi:ADP-ribose pyrophosphatase YjhB (NUDIX family)